MEELLLRLKILFEVLLFTLLQVKWCAASAHPVSTKVKVGVKQRLTNDDVTLIDCNIIWQSLLTNLFLIFI